MGEIIHGENINCYDKETGDFQFDVFVATESNEADMTVDEICTTITNSQAEEAKEREEEERQIQQMILEGDFKG